jgi:AcrR family transcriptional regulator
VGGDDVTTPLQGGRREQKKRETRRRLERIAVELFAERGYDDVTIDEIVAAAQTSKTTFYRYYAAKEDLLLSRHHHLIALIPVAVAARPPGEGLLDAVCNGLRDVEPQVEPDDDLVLDKARLLFETPSLASHLVRQSRDWESALAATIADRLGIADADDPGPQVLAAAILASLRVVVTHWLTHDAHDDFVDEARRQLLALRTTLGQL